MAGQSSVRPKTPGCRERQLLVDTFIAAAREVIRLQNRQIASGAELPERAALALSHELQEARRNKDEAMRAYVRHLEHHGCSC